MPRKRPVSITLSEFELDLARALARQEDRTVSYILGAAIEWYCKDDSLARGTRLDSKIYDSIVEKHFGKEAVGY